MEQRIPLKHSSTRPQKKLLTTSRLATELLTFAQFLCRDESSASIIVESSLRLFFYKNKSRFGAELKFNNFNPNEYVFKRNDYFFLLEKIIFFYKRDFLLKLTMDATNKFENLNWKQRAILVLSYRYKFGANDIANLLNISKPQFIEILYAAKLALDLDFEETELDKGDLLFSETDNHYFYKKNLDIHSSLNTDQEDEHSKLINKVIPTYPISTDEIYKTAQLIISSLKKVQT